MKQIAVLYSGGTDSTAATTLVAKEYERVHLLTFNHSGMKHIDNSRYNIAALEKLYGPKFVHVVMDVDKLFKMTTLRRYKHNFKKFGFFNLSTCGFCKLAMHLRTLIYCLENEIDEAADGANVNMSHFPAQMAEVLEELRGMYAKFGVRYFNPVFDYSYPDGLDWFDKLGLASLSGQKPDAEVPKKEMTTGRILFNEGILPAENVKGTALDRKMQARCFQLTLLNVFALGYFIPKHGMDEYRRITTEFFQEKIEDFSRLVEQYRDNPTNSELGKVIDG